MDSNVVIDLTRVENIDPLKIGRKASIMRRKPPLPGEQRVLQSALRWHVRLNLPAAQLVRDILDFKDKPHLRAITKGKLKHATVRPSTHFTITLGGFGSGGFGLGFNVGGGIYGCNSPELGFFVSAGAGFFIGLGVSGVIQVCFMLGLPSKVLAGEGIVVEVNGSIGVKTAGIVLIYVENPPKSRKIEFVGVGFQAGMTTPHIPVSIEIMGTRTGHVPILKP